MALSIAELRRLNNVSQQEMAEYIGVHVNTYRRLESNPKEFRVSQAVKIAKRFNVAIGDIIF